MHVLLNLDLTASQSALALQIVQRAYSLCPSLQRLSVALQEMRNFCLTVHNEEMLSLHNSLWRIRSKCNKHILRANELLVVSDLEVEL